MPAYRLAEARERRALYDSYAETLDFGLTDAIAETLSEWVGESAADMLDRPAGEIDDLDTLFLQKLWSDQVTFVLSFQVDSCREEGRSWDEIAAALRVSRQAAMKRFGYRRRPVSSPAGTESGS